jgi:hypothetical protein
MARIVSRVFDPIIEIPLVLSVAVWFALTNGLRWRFLIFILVIDALLPFIYILWGLVTKRISDWDMTKKEERRGIYVFVAITHAIPVVYAYLIGKTEMAGILLVFWSVAVVFAVITYFWKISVHAGVNGVMLAFFNHFWGWNNYWWLVLVLLLVLWARVEIKKHTWAQVLIGAGLAIGWVEVGFRMLNL